jgi:ppGpp synthetase/RelA/SpoT-type nucleotidyltranferase
MGTNFPNKDASNNMTDIIGVRVLRSQRIKLEEQANKNKIKISDIVREAITMWLNTNAKG